MIMDETQSAMTLACLLYYRQLLIDGEPVDERGPSMAECDHLIAGIEQCWPGIKPAELDTPE